MKFTANGYEIEIKAKRTCGGLFDRKRANAEDTKRFMADVAIWAARAADEYKALGLNALAKEADTTWNEIYDQLDNLGHFDDVAI